MHKRMFNMRISYYVAFIYLSIAFVISSSPKDYGNFSLKVKSFVTCQGPKRKECTTSKVVIYNSKVLRFDFTILQNISPTNGKILAITNGKQFLRLQMNKPCDHLFLRPLFQSIMNVTNECVILKGRYEFNVDIEEIASKYYGGMFLFGNFTFKSVFYNSNCNFYCGQIDVEFTPKNKTS